MVELFPAMPLADWRETKETLHRFEQIVGKIRLAASVRRNHWWNVPFQLTGRGLTTRPMGPLDQLFCIDFDLVRHLLVVDRLDGRSEQFSLCGQSVSSFYRNLFETIAGLGIQVEIKATPFDLADETPFAEDLGHATYDPAMVTRYWQVLSQVGQVLERFAADFSGKTSPVHHFWHTFDLALSRFTGRRSPMSAEADAVTREAYSHEVISFGFWFGDDEWPSPMFYAYTAPEPPGLAHEPLTPTEAFWSPARGNHLALLRYDDARAANDPAAVVLAFYDSAYRAGAKLIGCDIDHLSCPGGITDPSPPR